MKKIFSVNYEERTSKKLKDIKTNLYEARLSEPFLSARIYSHALSEIRSRLENDFSDHQFHAFGAYGHNGSTRHYLFNEGVIIARFPGGKAITEKRVQRGFSAIEVYSLNLDDRNNLIRRFDLVNIG